MPRLRLLPEVTTVYTERDAVRVLTYLMRRGGPIAIDTETTGLDVMRSRILFWSMATDTERYFIPLDFLLFFDPLFNRADISWYLANAKYDLHMLANMGVRLAGPVHDIIVMDAMDDDTRAHGLKEQARIAYDVKWGDFKDLFLRPEYVAAQLGLDKAGFKKFRELSLGDKLLYVFDENPRSVENYASCDAYFTYMRGEDLRTQLSATPLSTHMVDGFDTLYDYFEVIEVPFTKVLWKMERTGVPVDLDRVKLIDGPMREGIRKRERDIRILVGDPGFNVRSNDDLRALLFTKDGFNLSPVSYTKGKKKPLPSVSEKDLKLLLNRVPNRQVFDLITAVLEHRHLDKLHGTFVDKLSGLLGPDGRIHSRINQSGARTGRLSSSDPNLQNIPIRNDEFKIRSLFTAPIGMCLLDCDYPQIQPRLAAVFAGEEKLLEAIRNGWDIHSANAANMFIGKNPDATYEKIEGAKRLKEQDRSLLTEIQKILLTYRDTAKTVGLGVLFGEGPTKMGHQLRIDTQEARDHIERFFDTYPNLKKLIDDTHAECHEFGYAWTMLGRRRMLHMINNELNFGMVKAEERAGFNHKIQGSEVEVMKCAMLQLDASPDWQALGGELALTVHDELIGFAPKETAPLALEVMKAFMADPLDWGPIKLKLPVSVDPDGHYAGDWAEAH